MMTNNDQTDSFMFDLDNLIRRYQQEFDLNDQTIVGALEFAKLTVLTDAEILFTVDECSQSEYDVFGNESNDGQVLDDNDDDDLMDDFLSPKF